MSNAEHRGRFIWHELMTTDPDAAAGFYSKVVPWKTQPSGMPSYTVWMAGKIQAGGLMGQGDDARQSGAAPSWLVYVGTPDVDSTAAAAERLGGRVLKAATDIPGIGRFAVLADPQGAAFAVFNPSAPAAAGAAGAGGVGHFSWHELATTDPQAALGFYCELFGWTRGPAHDMGPAGVYQIIEHGGKQVGGMYALRDVSTPPRWLSYVQVASADRSAAAAKANGGRVAQGPMDVPGGSRVAQILDPQGGAFAVHEAPRAAVAQVARPAQAAPAAAAPAKRAAPRKSAGKKAAAKKAASGSGRSRTPKRAAGKRRSAKRKRPARAAARAGRARTASHRRAAASRSARRKGGARRAGARRSKAKSRSGRRR
jgi:predicted enzyme related to lactoylglutathione lyase